uniref:Uncharacterized protein n=1 Tax=Anguilla anguilla TaxID=7936 RepID=A0A0E9XGC5_ANGAN
MAKYASYGKSEHKGLASLLVY